MSDFKSGQHTQSKTVVIFGDGSFLSSQPQSVLQQGRDMCAERQQLIMEHNIQDCRFPSVPFIVN